MVNVANQKAYETKFDRHLASMSIDDAAKHHVGGIKDFYKVGAVEARVLENVGLKDGDYLIDLGCGAGRLAGALRKDVRYLGTDVVTKLIDYSRRQHPRYRFETVTDFTIPEGDEEADMVCAFSLFTHLLHEQTFLYVREAKRVLKPGGSLVFSFLEYANAGHRRLFLHTTESANVDRPLIVFNDRYGLQFFAEELGFTSIQFPEGDEALADFGPGMTMPDGSTVSGKHGIGQSLCVMTK